MLMNSSSGNGGDILTLVRDAPELIDSVAALAPASHAFLRSAWFAAGGTSPVETLAAQRASGMPLAAFPMVRRRLGPLAAREVAGCYWPFRSLPLTANIEDAELEAMLRHPRVRSHLGRIWRMGPVFADDPSTQRLMRGARRSRWTVIERRLGTIFEIDVAALKKAGPWPPSSAMRKMRYAERRLTESGPLQFRHATGAEWTSDDLAAIAAIEANSWVAKTDGGGDTKFLDPSRRRTWQRAAGDPVLADMLFCSILSVGDTPAAFTFGIQTGTMRYHIANGYDQRFAQHSPGRIVLLRDFERAAAAGVERISWGAGDAGYKTEMGAAAGPDILDLLFVRTPLLVPALRRMWTGSFRKS